MTAFSLGFLNGSSYGLRLTAGIGPWLGDNSVGMCFLAKSYTEALTAGTFIEVHFGQARTRKSR